MIDFKLTDKKHCVKKEDYQIRSSNRFKKYLKINEWGIAVPSPHTRFLHALSQFWTYHCLKKQSLLIFTATDFDSCQCYYTKHFVAGLGKKARFYFLCVVWKQDYYKVTVDILCGHISSSCDKLCKRGCNLYLFFKLSKYGYFFVKKTLVCF